MSNNAYLLNTPARVRDLASLQGRWLIVAEGRYRIPLPWLCMFSETDLRPCTIMFHQSRMVDGEKKDLLGKFSILNPSTSVQEAKRNLAKARPVFEALAGDPETGAKHWRAALASLEELPLDYLSLDPTELLLMGDLKEGAMELISALSSGAASLPSKRRMAGLEADAGPEKNFGGLDGGFLSVAFFQKCERSAEEAKSRLKLLARLDTCNLAQTGRGYEVLPLDLRALDPPESFWEDAELLARGARQVTVSHGPASFKDGKKHYATCLANVSNKRVRVRMFGGFNKASGSYALANYTRQWFTSRDFIDWYGVAGDGWIQPGETVTDPNNWGGSDEGFWAYWCEDEDGQRFIALGMHASSPSAGSGATELPPPWEPLQDSHRAAIQSNIANCKQLARDYSRREIGFDAAGVQWLDDLLQELHEKQSVHGERLIPTFGAFLGECIIRNFGGEWAIYDGSICVRFDGDAVFPLNKVRKQLLHGREGGDSVVGMYRSLEVPMYLPPTERQQQFLALYNAHKDYHYFVLETIDGVAEWAKVKRINGPWVAIESRLASGAGVQPEISVPLHQVSCFYITDANGVLIDSEGFSAASALAVPPAQSVKNDIRRRQIASHPPDASMESAIARLKSAYSQKQKSLRASTFESVQAPCPDWIKPSEPLYEILKQQQLLLTQGTIVWAALVQANNLLFSPGDVDCPAQLVYSRDPCFDSRPQELSAIASAIFKLKNTAPSDPAEKAMADRVTDEMDRTMGWRLPDLLTDKEVFSATFMVFRRHIPNGVLAAGFFPILVHPSTQAVMIVPFEFWPIELIILWKERKLFL